MSVYLFICLSVAQVKFEWNVESKFVFAKIFVTHGISKVTFPKARVIVLFCLQGFCLSFFCLLGFTVHRISCRMIRGYFSIVMQG